jgi:hypothetical protein
MTLSADDYAVPEKRALRIHDASAVRFAWDHVHATKGLTPDERKEARRRIKERATQLGLSTDEWDAGKLKLPLVLQAMSLNISLDDGHPNKMPFSGVMTRIDEPSDRPPEGSGGRLITISAEAAEKALQSLLGMAVDYKPEMDGHNPQAKIGLITGATIEGDAIVIEGFIYAADFPDVAAEIKASQDVLGFSYEARNLYTNDPDANPCVITDCVFTGAAILRKDKAAYRTTSIAAVAEEDEMSEDTKKVLEGLAEGVAALTKQFAELSASVEDLKKKGPEKVEANARTMSLVEPHAKACEACADGMEAAGVGADPRHGHVAVLRNMAGHMRAEAAMGRVPHVYRDHDYFVNAAADDKADAEMAKKLDEMVKPLAEGFKAMETKLADVKAAAVADAKAPERKTLPASVTTLLAKAGLQAPEDGSKFSLASVDAALKELPFATRLQVKAGLTQNNLLD